MKTVINRLLGILLLLVLVLPVVHAEFVFQEPNWDRGLAMRTAYATDTQALLEPLFQLVRVGDTEGLLASLAALQQDDSLSAPARDYLVFSFLLGLSDMDANSVDQGVLDYLSQYQVQTLVEHDDYAVYGVPLFNVQAAAAGVRNTWNRELAYDRAERLLQETPEQWISTYLAASQIERRGMIDALSLGTDSQLHELGRAALGRVEEQAELTLVAAQAGLEMGDFDLLQQAIQLGSGPGISQVLSAAAAKLDAESAFALLQYSIQNGPDSKAALTIAHLAPSHLKEPRISELLFNTMANQGLGAAAGMVLGASTDPDIQSRLSELAAGDKSPAQQRASLAISARQATQGDQL